ncbi:HPP family protein [Metapseudomonas boanensis]|uniref:HPP family protein n=1 Tax=Metapseudomonas boanensis TaxID=2822138 RepID=A0ABS5XK35_9GAMM|nr:HPP family protein [Pseudomonas boanensis]
MPETPLRLWLKRLRPAASSASPREWLRTALGACVAVTLAIYANSLGFGGDLASRLAAPFAASSVLLFALPSSPLAQPWPVMVGNLLAACIGLLVAQWVQPPLLAASVAIVLAIVSLHALRCLHPPSCAVALAVTLGGALPIEQSLLVLGTVLLGSLVLVGVAMLYNNLSGMPYPRALAQPTENPHHTADPLPGERNGIEPVDLDQALEEFGGFVDVTRDDLQHLLQLIEKHALRRRMGDLKAERFMSRDLRTVQPETPVSEAWGVLDQHHIKALPVLDAQQKLVGILTLADLLGHAMGAAPRTWMERLRSRRDIPVSRLMTQSVRCARTDTPLEDLVSLLSDQGLHCLPVLDEGSQLVGIVTQSDLIATLYRLWLNDSENEAAPMRLAS